MLKVFRYSYEDLTDEEKKNVSDNGWGKEMACYIKVTHNGETVLLESDAMEREDAMFCRDLKWVYFACEICYELGKQDAREEE